MDESSERQHHKHLRVYCLESQSHFDMRVRYSGAVDVGSALDVFAGGAPPRECPVCGAQTWVSTDG